MPTATIDIHPHVVADDEKRNSLTSLSQADRDFIFAKTAQTLYPALADRT